MQLAIVLVTAKPHQAILFPVAHTAFPQKFEDVITCQPPRRDSMMVQLVPHCAMRSNLAAWQ
eukprot:scaffold39761_cov32-Prasinocladus_malaysianus.AAC.1